MIETKQQRIEQLSADGRALLASRIREQMLADQNRGELIAEDQRLVAYVVAKESRSVSQAQLGDHAAARLPSYMVPWTIVELPTLPRMPNGKVDRTALPDPTVERHEASGEFIEPRNELEQTIADIWVTHLGIDCVGVKDNFFDLGGNSLTAVRLFAQINEQCRVNLRLTVLFENPTIEQLAEAIEAERDRRHAEKANDRADLPPLRYIVEMNPNENGTKTPLFLVAGMLGVVHNLQDLADRIGKGRRIYGIQAQGLAGEADPHTSLKEMADAYVEEVVRVQPKGPYLLGGFCSGGFVAMEIAERLRAQGEQTMKVVMLDTYSFPDMTVTARDKWKIHLHRFRTSPVVYPFRWFRDRVKWEWFRLCRWINGPTTDPAKRVAEAFYKATAEYQLEGYDGKVVLFRPTLKPECVLGPGRMIDEQRLFLFEDNNLRSRIPDLTVHEIPGGDHDSFVLEPNVGDLAQKLSESLDAS